LCTNYAKTWKISWRKKPALNLIFKSRRKKDRIWKISLNKIKTKRTWKNKRKGTVTWALRKFFTGPTTLRLIRLEQRRKLWWICQIKKIRALKTVRAVQRKGTWNLWIIWIWQEKIRKFKIIKNKRIFQKYQWLRLKLIR